MILAPSCCQLPPDEFVDADAISPNTALLPDGLGRATCCFEIDADGDLDRGHARPRRARRRARPHGVAVPGMPNLHRHAFQRAMAGLAERRPGAARATASGPGARSCTASLGGSTPDDVEAIAAQLYVELLKAGYTAVGEFHYLHHDPDGRPYADPAEMSRAHRSAAAAQPASA